MKVSKKFLNDYIDISNIDTKELANKMVFAGNEFEQVKKMSESTGLVVGYVLECEKHPESKKLSICKVDLKDEVVQIICGAPNVKAGIKVIVATIGAVLSGGFEIKKANLAGMESNGMICSLLELGISSKYLNEEDKNGIHILNDDAEIGIDAIKYLGYDDEIIDFELTSNRGDLLSILGMAYEVGALYDLDVKFPPIETPTISENINDSYELKITTDNCSLYSSKLVKNVEIKESPLFIKNRLIASGIRPINNVVDISNYVMLEYGTPLHFFDADHLGNYIEVRMAKQDEKLTTLDGITRELSETDIVIANKKEAVALAGVMGGLTTEITNETKNILIESAIFNPYNIRYTSKQILRSEASNRFEKGIDPNRSTLALKRACYLLNKYASGEVTDGILIVDKTNKDDKLIEITLSRINDVLGLDLSLDEVLKVFEKLKFKNNILENKIQVFVPTRRLDVNIKEDLIEEVGRIVGFDKITGSLPTTKIKKGSRTVLATKIKEIREHLLSLGLNQVNTYSLINEENSNLFINEKYEKVCLLNPISEDRKIMRNSLISSLIEVYNYNTSRNIKNINIFEIGSRYYIKDEVYKEIPTLTGLMTGHYLTNNWQNQIIETDFYLVKGVIENILSYLALNGRYQFITSKLKDMHPGRCSDILIDNNKIGFFGQVHPKISNKPVYVFEINLEELFNIKVRNIKYKDISKYPTITKDVAFVLKKEIGSSEVIKVIKKVGGRLLTEIDVFDVYVGENVEKEKKSIAYSLIFGDHTKTLSDEEVMVVFNKIILEVTEKLGAKVRNK